MLVQGYSGGDVVRVLTQLTLWLDSKFPGLKTLTPHRPPQPKPTRLNPDDCQELLNGWLRLLRSGLGVVSSGGGYTRLV